MAGLLPGYQKVVIDQFGGLNTLMDRLDLPAPWSPNCQDVEFVPGGVRSRYGFSALATDFGGTSVTGMRSYVNPTGTRKLLCFDSSGLLFKESAGSTTNIVSLESSSKYMKADTLYGRVYACISDGKVGVIQPLQYDDTNLDRVTGAGPYSAGSFAAADSGSAGSIPAGFRSVKVVFETRNGGLWPTDVAVTWTAAGSKKLHLTNIPTGPSYVKRRHVFVSDVFTAAPLATSPPPDWFRVTTINDNSTTDQDNIDFSTNSLYQGTSYNDTIARIMELPPQAGVIAYNSRLFFWGGLHNVPSESGGGGNPYDLSFDFSSNGGWTAADTGASVTTSTGAIGRAWVYTRAAGTFHSGHWTNNADMTNVFRTGQSISVRFRAKGGQLSLTQGSLIVGITNHSSVTVPFGSIDNTWQIYSGVVESGSAAIASSDVLYIDTTDIGDGNSLAVDWIELYETNSPNAQGVMWGSRAGAPEEIDALTGGMLFGPNDGQDIRDAFVLHGSLYAVKERSTYRTVDNGSAEPAFWPIERVSDVVGTYSLNGVGIGDNWVVIAARSGLYFFDGAMFTKISHEIQPTWDTINWQYGHTLWVVVDNEKKRVLCGLPLGANTTPSATYVLDYVEGWMEGQRKWAPWTFTGTAATISERADYSRKVVIGTSDATHAILAQYDTTARKDSAVTDTIINAYYETAPIGMDEGVTNFGGLMAYADGTGSGLLSYTDVQGTNTSLSGFDLANPALHDFWRFTNLTGERIGFRFGTDALTDWFALKRLTLMMKPHPFFVNRGYNP